MQRRATTGMDFEQSLVTKHWVKSEIKPKLIWNVSGGNVFEKMKNVGYDVNNFHLSNKSITSKSDFAFVADPTMRFEVKRYLKSQLTKWTMYSEPFFKVSTNDMTNKVDRDIYNKFVDDFMDKRKDIFEYVLNTMGEGIMGIRCLDGFIHQRDIEYKVQVLNGWKGYKRITVMFKIKDEV